MKNTTQICWGQSSRHLEIVRRILGFITAVSIFAAFSPNILAKTTGANIHIGDYLRMGTYYGEPIFWRCVDVDENGPLMFSDKIICLKYFDAWGMTNMITGSHSRRVGQYNKQSSYWGDSNICSWLNSTASAGDVQWLCGNPPDDEGVFGYNAYDKEAGFLTNFAKNEQDAIKTVKQKSVLSEYEVKAGMATTGNEQYYPYKPKIDDIGNYEDAYAEYITDKMFLLDMRQVNIVYNNRSILGDDYYIGEPTAQCVINADRFSYLGENSFAEGKKWYYWLRTPDNFQSGAVYCVDPYGYLVMSSYAHDGGSCDYFTGVRPAFYLDSTASLDGSGTESKPYTVNSASEIVPTPTMKPTPVPDPSFTINGQEVINISDQSQTAAVIIAEYEKGILKNITNFKESFRAGESKSFTLPKNGKFFVWDSIAGMRSLTN